MSLFFKDPKTCMNPWHGLAIIIFVCAFVLIALFIGRRRYEASLAQHVPGNDRSNALAGFSSINTSQPNKRLRF